VPGRPPGGRWSGAGPHPLLRAPRARCLPYDQPEHPLVGHGRGFHEPLTIAALGYASDGVRNDLAEAGAQAARDGRVGGTKLTSGGASEPLTPPDRGNVCRSSRGEAV
jgi:hypothetical protein